MTRLWLPFTVTDLPAALEFYRDRVGLPVVDGWRRDGEEGVVLHRYPRGHYGFEARGPAGATVMVWSER